MPVRKGHTKNIVISRWNKPLIIEPAVKIKVNDAGVLWNISNMCKDAQALICWRCCGSLLAVVTHRGWGDRLRDPVKHLVCDEIEAVVPRLCATGIWIGRRIEPAADLECAKQTAGFGALANAEVQFVDREIAIRGT